MTQLREVDAYQLRTFGRVPGQGVRRVLAAEPTSLREGLAAIPLPAGKTLRASFGDDEYVVETVMRARLRAWAEPHYMTLLWWTKDVPWRLRNWKLNRDYAAGKVAYARDLARADVLLPFHESRKGVVNDRSLFHKNKMATVGARYSRKSRDWVYAYCNAHDREQERRLEACE